MSSEPDQVSGRRVLDESPTAKAEEYLLLEDDGARFIGKVWEEFNLRMP